MPSTSSNGKILIVDDEVGFVDSLERELGQAFEIIAAYTIGQAKKQFAKYPDAVLLDISLSDGREGREGVQLLNEFLSDAPDIPIIMHSAYGDIRTAVDCMKRGAVDFIPKPPDIDELIERLQKAIDKGRLAKRSQELEHRLEAIDPTILVGESHAIRSVKQSIQMVAVDGNASVLIRGETGTGKELVARSIHEQGVRQQNPFIPVALVALSDSLIESELFGHEAGAFTGAEKRRIGYIEEARNGVLFLDEIGDLSIDIQLKLLRFLDQRKFNRLGNSKEQIEVDLQIVTATNRDMEADIKEGRMREDFFYRIKNIEIHLPPLRERVSDIPLIVQHFLELFHKQGRAKIGEFSPGALEILAKHSWPGNVRELKSAIERALIYAQFHKHNKIEPEDLPAELVNQTSSTTTERRQADLSGDINLGRELARYELQMIESALEQCEEEKSAAAQMLGMNDRFAIRRRIKTQCDKYPDLLSEFPLIKKLYYPQI